MILNTAINAILLGVCLRMLYHETEKELIIDWTMLAIASAVLLSFQIKFISPTIV
jgi:hypothetical protein